MNTERIYKCFKASFLILFGGLLPYNNCSAFQSSDKKTIAKIPGDITIGALFPMHHIPSATDVYTRKCGAIREQYGIQRFEIFLKTLDEINANPNILPNVTLGCDIRDSCWYPPVALEQSIDFIKNSIASQEKLNKNRTGESGDGSCDTKSEDPIAGLIGPGSSSVTIQIQNLLSLFQIPQIGYSATSKDLSDKSSYKYFLRVVPSDKLQARALLDIVRYYNWTYISTVHTIGNYGSSGMEEFQEMMEEVDICEANTDRVVHEDDDEAHDLVIQNLLETPNARVVVCFCEGLTIRRLMKAADRKGKSGHFLFLGSDGWNVRQDVVEDIESLAAGGISMKLHSPKVESFKKHYLSLKPSNNARNPWFTEFWEEKFHCKFNPTDSNIRKCKETEDLSEEFSADAKLGFVVNAVYTMAYALHNMYKDVCDDTHGLCKAMIPINGSLFRKYLFNVSFTSYSGLEISFNEHGDPPARYDIMNYQPVREENGTLVYEYVKIGEWDSGILNLSDNVFWPGEKFKSSYDDDEEQIVESVCSKPCDSDKIMKINDGGVPCCWICTPCQDNEYLVDTKTCRACDEGWYPNENKSGCYEIPVEYMEWHDTEAIIAIVLSCIGVISTGWTALVFMRHNDTPVVKASTRELSYIILVGICICYLTSFPLVAKPTLVTCYLVRILPGFAFSLIYGALVTKTNRIARILAGSKKKIMTRKPRFMTSSAQLVITFIIIGIEVAIIVVMLIFEPADFTHEYPEKTRVRRTCDATTKGIIVPLGFIGFLIAMCTLYAVKTRNLPENFNEAKFIGFTMYTTCIIWLAFVGIYFGSDNKVITMCMAITLSATVALVLLFFPKIYIIVCKPEKNNRSAFTTSKEVRCHIGSTARYSSSSPSVYQWKVEHPPSGRKVVDCEKAWNEKTFESAAMTIYRQKNAFDRWHRKSSPLKSETGAPDSPAYSQVAPSGSNGVNQEREADMVDVQMTPVKGKVIRRIKAPAPFKDFEMEFDEMDAMMAERETLLCETKLHQRPALKSSAIVPSTMRPVTADCSVQTGHELLQNMLVGLRKRKSSNKDIDTTPVIRTDEPNRLRKLKTNASSLDFDHDFEKSRPRSTSSTTSFPSDNYLSIRNHHYRPPSDKSPVHYPRSANEATLLSSPQNYSTLPAHKNHSSLVQSPSGDMLEGESTSEETLSELAEPMHDLDKLLRGIAPHKDSLENLHDLHLYAGDNSARDSNETVIEASIKIPSRDPLHSTLSYNGNKRDSNSNSSKPRSKNDQNYYPVIGNHVEKASLSPRISLNDSGYKAHSPVHNANTVLLSNNVVIPSIHVEGASLSSSDMSADSGRPSERVSDLTYDADSRRTSFRSALADRTSAEISSIDDISFGPTDTPTADSPVFYSSDNKQSPQCTANDSVTDFKDYLRKKGLKLDLKSVQSSEV